MSGPFPHQPRFPNKIFSLIIDNLAHHPPPTLRNLAIVCKEFSHRTRPLLFRNIDLRSSLRVQAFAEFLRDPSRTALLGQYVQSLSYGPGKDTDLPYLETIIRSLPSLTSVKLYLPDISFFPAIEAHLAGKITKLHIECLEYLDSEELQSFKSMLASLNGLRHLSMMVARMSYDDDDEIILPTSLETLSLVFLEMDFMMLRAIKRGMQGSSRAPSFKLVLIVTDQSLEWGQTFWEALPMVSSFEVVLPLDDEDISNLLENDDVPSMPKCKKVVISCPQDPFLPVFFSEFILDFSQTAPVPEREICIDFTPTRDDHVLTAKEIGIAKSRWARLDKVLVNEHESGELKRVCFRCTRRDGPYTCFDSLRRTYEPANRTILDWIESFLPRSKSMGFIEVDFSTIFFETSF